MKVVLEVIGGPLAGRRLTYEGHDAVLLGKSRACGLCVKGDRFVSRNHFLLEFNPPRCYLRDLGSRNGTKVNGERVKEAFLRSGDEIKVGHTRLVVQVEGGGGKAGGAVTRIAPLLPELAVHAAGAAGAVPASALGPACLRCERGYPTAAIAADAEGRIGADYLCRECRRDLDPRQPLASYYLIRELGRGGTGIVYLARDAARPGSLVALKTLKVVDDLPPAELEERMARFRREGEIGLSLRHPNVVETLKVGVERGVFFLASEYVRGGDLLRRILGPGRPPGEPEDRLPVPVACRIGLQVLDGVACAHEQGIVHRDLKPSNILLTDGAPPVAKVADFGLAKNLQLTGLSEITHSQAIAGSPSYMAPEQVAHFKGVGPRADVFSLGATLYFMLTGTTPYQSPAGEESDPILALLEGSIVPIGAVAPRLPAPIARVVDRAIAADPGARFADAAEMKAELLFALGASQVEV